MTFLSIGSLSFARGNDDKWKTCSADIDCIPVVELCGGAGAINKKFIDNYYKYRNDVSSKTSCNGFKEGEWKDNVKAVCEKSSCTVKQSSSVNAKNMNSLSNAEIVNVKLQYAEIENNVSSGDYRSCFYNILKLKQIISSYENAENHFFFCKQNIK